jgi:hypothetical protein
VSPPPPPPATAKANEAVPCNEPVNPAVDSTLPLNTAGPMFVNVLDPDTIKDPVICTCEPEAKIRFDLAPSDVPLPTIKALCAEDEILY